MSATGYVVTESLTCSICSELLNEPKQLSCTHTFCKNCLQTIVSSHCLGENQLSCPSCQQVTHLGNGDVSKLQTNAPFNALLEELKSTMKYCTICDAGSKTLALAYCWQCNEFLCQSCHIAHGKFKKISNHDVVNVSDVESGKVRVKQFCDLHPHEELEFVCSPCKEPICFRCRVLDHSGGDHQVVGILAFQKTLQSQAKSLQYEAEKKISAIKVHIGGVEEHLVMVGSVLGERVGKIHETYNACFQKFSNHLAEKRNELSNKVQQQREVMTKELEDIKEMNIKSLAHIKSLYETMMKATEGFLEGDALVAHNKVCNELEEILHMDVSDERKLWDIGQRAQGVKLRIYQPNGTFSIPIVEVYQAYEDQSSLSPQSASTKAVLNWNIHKINTLSIAAAKYSNMVPTPDGKMAVGYQLGGIDVFNPMGLQDTVLQGVKVNSVAVLSDGRYVVRDRNRKCKITAYDCDWNQLGALETAGGGKLYIDQEDNVVVNNYRDPNVCSTFKLVPDGNDGKKVKFEKVREICPGGLKELIPLNHQSAQFIRIDCKGDEYSVKVLDRKQGILYERAFGRHAPSIAVLQDGTILIGWVAFHWVTIERYTHQLRFVKTLLSNFTVDEDDTGIQLGEFSTGEIVLCDGKTLHVFRKSH